LPNRLTRNTFQAIVSRHYLSSAQADQLIVIADESNASIKYIDMLLQEGFTCAHIVVAYRLRDELGTLHSPGESRGGLCSEFQLPIKSCCELLQRLWSIEQLEENVDDVVEATATLLCGIASRYDHVRTWSKLLLALNDNIETVLTAESHLELEMLDSTPVERVDGWLDIIDDIDLITDH
jgi:hypothetical protein